MGIVQPPSIPPAPQYFQNNQGQQQYVVPPVPTPTVANPGIQNSNTSNSTTLNNLASPTANASASLRAVQITNFNTFTETSVGDIRSQRPAITINGGYNEYSGGSIQVGISIPLGVGRTNRAAENLAISRTDVAAGSICKSVMQSGFTREIVESLYGKNSKYQACVVDRVVATSIPVEASPPVAAPDYHQELIQLRAELKALKERAAASPGYIPRESPQGKPVRGLW